jgi:ABC-type multidrug transport system fused ATPase/permease subunit
MSFVLQDTVLFHVPIWQNIAYGKPEAQRAEIIRAAKMANAHEFIEKMPDGYDTMVGERGVSLSGGQRQRIALARTFYRDAPILLLDEPTVALDRRATRCVMLLMEKRRASGCTIIAVTHSRAVVQIADHVLVFKDGRAVPADRRGRAAMPASLALPLHASPALAATG